MQNPKTFIIIPAHNEERHIGEVVKKAKAFGSVIVVDDGSNDATAAAAKAQGAEVISHIINLGKGAALKTGCDRAVKDGASQLVVLDADSQHDPEEIPIFLAALRDAGMVFGYRAFSKEMPFILRLGNWAISKMTRILFGVKINDTQSGYRAFTSDTYQKIRWASSSYSMESEMIANMAKHNLKYSQVPIKTIYADRYKGTTIIDGIKIVMNLLWWKLAK